MGRKKRKRTRARGGRNQATASAVAVAVAEPSGGGRDNAPAVVASAVETADIGTDDRSEPNPVQSSWLHEVEWICQASPKIDSAPPVPTHTATDRRPPSPSACPKSEAAPSDGHESLSAELNRIKRRLMPAAQACADAVNGLQGGAGRATTPEREFKIARSACNRFECLGETFSRRHRHRRGENPGGGKRLRRSPPSGLSRFVNRSAIKLANIDALLHFRLARRLGPPDNGGNGPFVFVDLCGAPGGFSEYLLHRWAHPAAVLGECASGNRGGMGMGGCLGFGMSLSGRNEDGTGLTWDLDHLERYHLPTCPDGGRAFGNGGDGGARVRYRVCHGVDGTGSVYSWENVLHLRREASRAVAGGGRDAVCPPAHLVVADGGIDAQRDSDDQESVALRIVASQAAAALALLRKGGMFVMKMFGFRGEATRRILRDLQGRFDGMTFLKPVSSRPASAERYLVCRGYVGLESGWDGVVWRDRMLKKKTTSEPPCNKSGEASDDAAAPLEELMDSFDLGLLRLNIITCRAIVNFLELRKEAADRGNDVADVCKKGRSCIDPSVYEAAWQIL